MLSVGAIAASGCGAGQVGALAGDELHRELVPDVAHRQRQPVDEPIGQGVGEVADQDGEVDLECVGLTRRVRVAVPARRLHVGGRTPPPRVRLVHDAVVHQRKQVQGLEGGGQADDVPVASRNRGCRQRR